MRTRPTPPPPAATPPDAGPARQNGGETTAAAARAHHEQLAVTPREGALFVQTIFPPTPAANDGPDPASSRHMPYGRDYRPRGYSVDATSSHVHQRRAQFTLSAAGAHNSGEADVGDDYACELCDVVCNDPFELELHERSHDDESAAARHRDRRAAGPAGRGGFSDTAAAGSEYHAMEIEEEEEEGGDGDGDGDGDDDPSRSKPHGCPVCPRRFRYRGEVAVHARTHTGEKPFTCPHVNCTMRFKSRPELQKHGKTHSGDTDKLFGCGLCEKRFRRKDDAVRHERTHSIEKPHRCNACDRRFQRPSDLVRHERTHTGEKPYGCTYCPKRYTRRSDALTHERAAHINAGVVGPTCTYP